MESSWGWEKPEDRLRRFARVSARRKLQALEEMRLFVKKYSIVKRSKQPQKVA